MSQKNYCKTYGSYIPIDFVLLARTRHCKEEVDEPGNADLSPHLQIDGGDPRVQRCTHEYVVYKVSRHANLFSTSNGPKIDTEANGETVDYGDSHKVAKVIDYFR